MRAAAYTAIGAARDVLSVQEGPPARSGPGQVRVRVQVSAVNPTDTKTRDGTTQAPVRRPADPAPGRRRRDRCRRLGRRPGCVGQRVWVWLASPGGRAGRRWPSGGPAPSTPWCRSTRRTPLPDGASDDLAPAWAYRPMTAYRCLHRRWPVDGLTVPSPVGAGGSGLRDRAGPLGRGPGRDHRSGPEKAELAREAGAEHVVTMRGESGGSPILDAVGQGRPRCRGLIGQNLDHDLKVIRVGAPSSATPRAWTT